MTRSYTLCYLPRAKKDLEDIFGYICLDSPSRAALFLTRIDHALSRLARLPLAGFLPRDLYLKQKGYRLLVIRDYLVFYRVEKKRVVIYRVIHGKRRYEFLLK